MQHAPAPAGDREQRGDRARGGGHRLGVLALACGEQDPDQVRGEPRELGAQAVPQRERPCLGRRGGRRPIVAARLRKPRAT